jgi:glutamate-1-semialdehyde 2,1-aminomutase
MKMSQMSTANSKRLFERACKVLPEGVNSPVRGPRYFKPYPMYMKKGQGSKLFDVDGNEYVDFNMALGPLIHGHAPPRVIEAVKKAMDDGTMLGVCQEIEVEVAEKIDHMVPNADLIRFTNSGTEATMHAIRLARGYSGKKKILKFEGHFHGNHDYVLVNIQPPAGVLGSRICPVKIPQGPGIPEETLSNTLVIPWNDSEILEETVRRHKDDLALVISEPVMGNCGHIAPKPGYLKSMREITTENDVLLLFDEVITGFRLAPGGAQEYFKIDADLVTMAKALGAGFPIGAFAGKREVMNTLVAEKCNPVHHSGTYNANALCLHAARASLKELTARDGEAYRQLHAIGNRMITGIRKIFEENKVEGIVQGIGPMFQVYFTKLKSIRDSRDFVTGVDQGAYSKFGHELLRRGVFISPIASENWFISTAHSNPDVDRGLRAVNASVKALKEAGTLPTK